MYRPATMESPFYIIFTSPDADLQCMRHLKQQLLISQPFELGQAYRCDGLEWQGPPDRSTPSSHNKEKIALRTSGLT